MSRRFEVTETVRITIVVEADSREAAIEAARDVPRDKWATFGGQHTAKPTLAPASDYYGDIARRATKYGDCGDCGTELVDSNGEIVCPNCDEGEAAKAMRTGGTL